MLREASENRIDNVVLSDTHANKGATYFELVLLKLVHSTAELHNELIKTNK